MRDRVLVLIVVAATLVVLAPVLLMGWWMAFPGGWMMRGGSMGRGMMDWGQGPYGRTWIPMATGALVFLVLLGLVGVGAYYLFSNRGTVDRGEDRSIGVLRERFAKGEITEEQFQRMKKQLQD